MTQSVNGRKIFLFADEEAEEASICTWQALSAYSNIYDLGGCIHAWSNFRYSHPGACIIKLIADII